MADYTQITDFSAKDALATGNPSKIVLGAELDAEFAAIETSLSTKIDDTTVSSPSVITTLADADQLRIWYNSGSGERQITAANAGLYFGIRPTLKTYTSLAGATQVTFSSLPNTVRRITVALVGVGFATGTTNIRIRVGDSSGILTTNYVSGDGRIASGGATFPDIMSSTTGFDIYQNNALRALHGSLTLTIADDTTRTWVCNWDFYDTAGQAHSGGGSVVLPTGVIDRIQITTVSAVPNLTGNANVIYE